MNAVSTTLSGYSLSSKAMLVSLTLRAWGGQRLDQSETSKVAKANKASSDAVRVTKDLVGKHLDGVRQSERAIRAMHRKYTLPWADDSTRLLPTAVWEDYSPAMRTLIERHEQQVIPAFIEDYHRIVIPSAQQRLGDLFNAADFPDDIEGRFGVSLRFLPVPDSADVRVRLSDAEVQALREEVEEATREAYEAANREIVERASQPLQRLAEALREYGPGKRLSKSLLENVADIASLMPGLDLSGRPEVVALAREIEALAAHSTDRLTSRQRLRESVAAEADRLLGKINDIF
ncbi:hypothetical protein [Planktothrix phage Pra-JY27]|nr:hypothetical protein [Planktothrix phage Pag-Yong1]WEV89256.1 DUF3150 domain-containing protein [Synechococcus phage MinM2]